MSLAGLSATAEPKTKKSQGQPQSTFGEMAPSPNIIRSTPTSDNHTQRHIYVLIVGSVSGLPNGSLAIAAIGGIPTWAVAYRSEPCVLFYNIHTKFTIYRSTISGIIGLHMI